MTIYYLKPGGNDLADGLSEANAWGTVSKVNASVFAPGDIIRPRHGTYRETLMLASSGLVNNPLIILPWGDGSKPIFSGADIVTGMVLNNGTVYTKSGITIEPAQAFYNEVRLTAAPGLTTAVGVGQWDWDANTLYLNVGEDPAGGTVEIDQRDYGVACITDYLQFNNVVAEKVLRDCWSQQGGTERIGNVFNNIIGRYTVYSVGDGFTQHIASMGTVVNRGEFHHCTRGITCTGTSQATFNRCLSYDNHWGEFSDTGTYIYNDCDFFSNNINFQTGDAAVKTLNRCKIRGATGTGAGVWANAGANVTLNYCRIYDNLQWGVITNQAGAVVTLSNCVVSDNGPDQVYAVLGTTTIKNTVFYGGNTLLRKGATATLTADYNQYYRTSAGNAWRDGATSYTYANFANWKASTSQDTNSQTGDPSFMNLSTKDFRLQAASPCRDKGTDLSLLYDAFHAPVPVGTIPDIGCHEYGGGSNGRIVSAFALGRIG